MSILASSSPLRESGAASDRPALLPTAVRRLRLFVSTTHGQIPGAECYRSRLILALSRFSRP